MAISDCVSEHLMHFPFEIVTNVISSSFQIILALFIVCLIPGLPESPRWLVLKGRDEKAIEVLAALSDLPEDDIRVQDEYKAVKDTVFTMAQGSFADAFKINRNRNLHRTILGYVNQMFQQISGMLYHALTISCY